MVTKHIASFALSGDELDRLVDMVIEWHGTNLSRSDFAEAMLGIFEDVPGFEAISQARSQYIVLELWSTYMVKKSAKNEVAAELPAEQVGEGNSNGGDTAVSQESAEPKEVDLTTPAIAAAIARGKSLIADGKSKADAAREIFTSIKDETKDTIVAAFVAGATLTPKGALTYWYNCRRQASKVRKSA